MEARYLPVNGLTKQRRWPLGTTGQQLPRDAVGRVKVRIELIRQAMKTAERQMLRLTEELAPAAPSMRPATRKFVLEYLQVIHESWVLRIAASFSQDALQEGRRVFSEAPRHSKKTAAAEAWLRRQLAGLGKETR